MVKAKAFWRKTGKLSKSLSPQPFLKSSKNALAGASGDIKFNEPNRAGANALG